MVGIWTRKDTHEEKQVYLNDMETNPNAFGRGGDIDIMQFTRSIFHNIIHLQVNSIHILAISNQFKLAILNQMQLNTSCSFTL